MTEMTWDLSVLVESTEPEYIREKLAAMIADHAGFAERYRGRVVQLDEAGLAGMLEDKDDLYLRFEGVLTYCSLLFAADQGNPLANALNDDSSRAATEADQHMAFLWIELAKLLASRPEMVEDPLLLDHRHYLERCLRMAPHLLSEAEERLIVSKDRTGIMAWSRLQSKWLSSRQFRPIIRGEEKVLSMGEVIPYIYDPDRDTRKAVYQAMGATLAQDGLLWADALSTIWKDHEQMCRLRRYPSPLTSSLISNDVEEGAILALMNVVRKNAPLCQRYFGVKARMLGLETLGSWDLRAPLLGTADKERTWQEARDLLISVYSSFDLQYGQWVREMFDLRRMDGVVRKGKRTGAFCDTWVGGRSAFILSSYNRQLNDLFTLAHELGHGVHAYLYTRAQNPSNCMVSLCVAECGSMFGELLLTERLLNEAAAGEERKAVLVKVMNSFVQTVYQEGFRYFFEMDVARAVEEGRYLDGDAISDLWMAAQRSIYGEGIEYLPEMRWDWARFPHHYFSGIRFYEYPYVFAQLFVFALYRLYKEQGSEFVPRMNTLLAAGSSRSAAQLAADLGFDIAQEDFWQKGIDQAREFLEELERLG
ncbi:MAG: M3 family oligoendopeptidase [Methanomassiliicoccus sp.]|nr:M3 family oligoendopeptidase [Methanomassiliicoccus sp.]